MELQSSSPVIIIDDTKEVNDDGISPLLPSHQQLVNVEQGRLRMLMHSLKLGRLSVNLMAHSKICAHARNACMFILCQIKHLLIAVSDDPLYALLWLS